ncbi:MAG: hypothetical protein J5I47_05830 [Vicingus serpentipes]|nr:hypothetical protein [Vicingus serpentipes]
MKKLISILLLLCLILPFVGTVSWLNYQKKKIKRQIKHEIIAGIDKSELVQFTFTKTQVEEELNWRHSKEFEYNNSMYDIVEADTTNNTVTYWCWWDYKETKLNKQLSKLLAQFLGNDTQSKETKTRFAQFCQSLYYTKNIPWKVITKETNTSPIFAYTNTYISLHFPPTTPPPNYS